MAAVFAAVIGHPAGERRLQGLAQLGVGRREGMSIQHFIRSGLALIILSSPLSYAIADQLDWSPQKERAQRLHADAVAYTYVCLVSQLKSMLRAGYRDRDGIASTIASRCTYWSLTYDDKKQIAYEIIAEKFSPRKSE